MKKIVTLLLFSCLNSAVVNCQLLRNPPLTVEDFEKALTNADLLRKVLSEHNFEYNTTGASNLNSPGTMPNQLYPDLRILKSENWQLKDPGDHFISIIIDMFYWEPNHSPQPEVIKSIRIVVNQNSKYAERMVDFLEKIKSKYPDQSKSYFRNDEFFKQNGEPLIVFTNGSNIEVRTETDPRFAHFYTVIFDLKKSK